MKTLITVTIPFLLIYIFSCSGTVTVPPSITNAGEEGVNYKDGDTLVINGSNFGNHDLDIEWLGGKNGHIETMPAGTPFVKDKWNRLDYAEGKQAPVYSTSNAYSGNQSVMFDSITNDDGRFKLTYDPGYIIEDIAYLTYYVYINTALPEGEIGQWKMFRLSYVNNVQDTGPELVMFNWFNGSSTFSPRRFNVDGDGNPDHENQVNIPQEDYPRDSAWYRMELIFKPSVVGGYDGAASLWVHKCGESINHIVDMQNIQTYVAGEENRYRYFIFQNYQGEGYWHYYNVSTVWNDDYYIQLGTLARIEIGNKPDWNDCTQREIQYPVSWTEDKIEIEINRGTLPINTPLYLFVVNSLGNVSDGSEIIIKE